MGNMQFVEGAGPLLRPLMNFFNASMSFPESKELKWQRVSPVMRSSVLKLLGCKVQGWR